GLKEKAGVVGMVVRSPAPPEHCFTALYPNSCYIGSPYIRVEDATILMARIPLVHVPLRKVCLPNHLSSFKLPLMWQLYKGTIQSLTEHCIIPWQGVLPAPGGNALWRGE
uniref:Uncharacterized protein n=1 Tax=Terrapene triunguis TaxID=2587831 RepID=A0A674JN86_9SAUR